MPEIADPDPRTGQDVPGRYGWVVCPSGKPGLTSTEYAARHRIDPKTANTRIREDKIDGAEWLAGRPGGPRQRYFVSMDDSDVQPEPQPDPNKYSSLAVLLAQARAEADLLRAEVDRLKAENRHLKAGMRGMDNSIEGLRDSLRELYAPDSLND